MDIGLSGKNVVVTGAGRGIGQEIAIGFAEVGAKVVGVGEHPPQKIFSARFARRVLLVFTCFH